VRFNILNKDYTGSLILILYIFNNNFIDLIILNI